MTPDLEYFLNCFDDESKASGLGIDDLDLAYGYMHSSDTKKFMSGFAEYLKLNQFVFTDESDGQEKELIYDTSEFVKWINENMDAEDFELLGAATWTEYRLMRLAETGETALSGRVIPIA